MKSLLIALSLFNTQAEAQTTANIQIPNIVIQCEAGELPCSAGGGNYSTSTDPVFALGTFITTESSCLAATMQSSASSTAAIGIGFLSEKSRENDTYYVYLNKFFDSNGHDLDSLQDQPYTMCFFYASVDANSVAMSYYKEVHLSLKNIETIVIDSKNWIAL